MKKYFSISFIIISLFVTIAVVQKGNTAQSPKYFAYVANSGGDNKISAYSINPSTGILIEIKGSPFPAGIDPISMAVHPNRKYIYAVNYESHNISAYFINPLTGALSQVKGSPFPLNVGAPVLLKIAPSGKFLYTANIDGYISIYKVNAKTGILTAIKGSPFYIQNKISDMAFAPTGKLALIINHSRNSVISYFINDKTGRFTRVKETTIKSGKNPNFITVDPTGKFAFVSNSDSGNLSVYSINTKKGILSEIKGSPFNVGRLNDFIFARKFAYILRLNIIDAYCFDPTTGSLTTIKDGCYGFSDSNWLTSLAVDQNHKFLYAINSRMDLVPNSFNAIYAYSINPTTGKLTELMESSFDTGDHPGQIIIVEK